ncbi:MAG: MutH/Sau3AI family endonuclease [Chloroflexota bacterium]
MAADLGPWALDYRTATESEILARARLMVDKRLGELAQATRDAVVSSGHTRGDVGAMVEAWFGILPNSVQAADFPGAGIELKTVPLSGSDRAATVKERTVLTMVDYDTLPNETWETAAVRHKLDRILFVYYRWSPDTDLASFPVELVTLWQPTETQLQFMELDWLEVQEKVVRGEAHLISEGDGLMLGAATKAADSSKLRPQPYSDIPAKPRAWSLKQTFTRALYVELKTKVQAESLMRTLEERRAAAFERVVLAHYARFVGRRVGDVAQELGIEVGGKQGAATVLRAALGQRQPERGIKEFLELGIELKMVRADATGMPYEAMSFPAFRYRELITEDWEHSDLLARLNRFLVLPLDGAKGLAATADCILREPFFWSPSPDELAGIGAEWTIYRDLIAAGRAADLPGASQTRFIHVRPKAQDSNDTDDAPVVGPVVKKCFWLNRSFVAELLRSQSWGQASAWG